jgi:hypothetical protein
VTNLPFFLLNVKKCNKCSAVSTNFIFSVALFCGLFYNALGISGYVASDGRMIGDNELEIIWKEAIMT